MPVPWLVAGEAMVVQKTSRSVGSHSRRARVHLHVSDACKAKHKPPLPTDCCTCWRTKHSVRPTKEYSTISA